MIAKTQMEIGWLDEAEATERKVKFRNFAQPGEDVRIVTGLADQ